MFVHAASNTIFTQLEGSGGAGCYLGVRNYQLGVVLGSPCILFHTCTYPELQWQRRQPRGLPEEQPPLTSSKCLASLRQRPYPHAHTRRQNGMQDSGTEIRYVAALLITTPYAENHVPFAEAKEEGFDAGSSLERSVSEFLI